MNRMQELRKSRGISMKEAATLLGMPYTTYVNYEKGFREPNSETLIKIADFFQVTIDYLIGNEDKKKPTRIGEHNIPELLPIEKKKIRLLGNVACGEPIWANEDLELYVEAGTNIHADFCLRAKGDSMINARIYDGDIVFVRQQDIVDNGEIAVVLIGDEATLKRIYFDREAGILQLVPENPKFSIKRYSGSELDSIRILGKAVAFQSGIR